MKRYELVPLRCLQQAQARYPVKFSELRQKWDSSGTESPPFPDTVRLIGLSGGCSVADAVGEATFLCACAGWGAFRKVYAFDEALAQSLVFQVEDLSDTDVLPAQILNQLPFPCFYVQAADIVANGYDGFFVWKERGGEEIQLRFLFVSANCQSILPGGVSLRQKVSLGDCFPGAEEIAQDVIYRAFHGDELALRLIAGTLPSDAPAGAFLRKMVLRAVQLVLYIISADAEVSSSPKIEKTPSEGVLVNSENDLTYVDTQIYDVGVAIGHALRQDARSSRGAGGGKSAARRAHVRRGHWHHYWTGPKKDPDLRQLVLKWINPMNVTGIENETVQVTPVN